MGHRWMEDMRFGICPEAFWLNKDQCCWSSNETFFEGDNCSQVWASTVRWYFWVSANQRGTTHLRFRIECIQFLHSS